MVTQSISEWDWNRK